MEAVNVANVVLLKPKREMMSVHSFNFKTFQPFFFYHFNVKSFYSENLLPVLFSAKLTC